MGFDLSGSAGAAFDALPPDVQASLQSVVPPQTRDAGPALDLATTIARGGVPSDASIVAAMGGIASLVGGPVAGAAMTAIGAGVVAFESGLQTLFSALGLYDAPIPTFSYHGLQRIGIDQLPYGPTDKANWWGFDRWEDVGSYRDKNWGGRARPGGRPPYRPNQAEGNDPWQNTALELLQSSLFLQKSPADRWRWYHGVWPGGNAPFKPSGSPSAADLQSDAIYLPLRPFESFFLTLLKKNMTYWANGWPFIPPHSLLRAALDVWNRQHTNAKTWTFDVYEGSAPYYAAGKVTRDVIPLVLSGYADSTGNLQAMGPVTVNEGDAITPRTWVPRPPPFRPQPVMPSRPSAPTVASAPHTHFFAATLAGAIVGAPLGGPIGSLVGGAAGFAVDRLRAYADRPPPNVQAAQSAYRLLKLGQTTAAAGWISQFQTSVGLPATGQLDAKTRAAIVRAVPGARL